MTTCPGSGRSLSRSTMVAAGMPATMAQRAAPSVSHPTAAGATPGVLAAPSQSKPAAADPQLPGPGRSKPAPKKVPTVQAQAVFFPLGGASLIAGRARPHLFKLFQQVGIEYGRGDAVDTASPLAQIDGLAMIAAEGEIRILGGDNLPASRAAKAF